MVLKQMAAYTGRLPTSTLETLGRGLGRIAYGLDVRHRRIILQNLAFIYPDWDSPKRRQVARSVFKHFGIVLLEILQASFLSRAKLAERVRVEGLNILEKAMNQPNGCLVYSAHLGNWELGFLAVSARLNRSVVTVAKPIKWQRAHAWLTGLRSRFGNRVVFKEGAMPFMIRSLRKGNTVAVLIDQGVRRNEAVEVSFFGKRTMATPSVALLAMRCRAPVVPIFCVREGDGRYCVKVRPPVPFERTDSLRHDVQAYTQKLLRLLEEAIKDYPEQWFWFHKRWKRTYPDIYPEYQIVRRRKRLKKGLEA